MKKHHYTSGFRNYPENLSKLMFDFQNVKAQLDGNNLKYWRVHDKLYDLRDFASSHPGGSEWIRYTKGLDITELFESSHISDKAERILHKFYVCDAEQPRNSPFTFSESGFYKTLKRRVAVHFANRSTGPSWKSKAVIDALVAAAVICGWVAAYQRSLVLTLVTGILMHMIPPCAHNFIHQRNSWRMYYIGLCYGLSVATYRYFHVLSHHPFPNTVFDLELDYLEPHLTYKVNSVKPWKSRWLNIFFYPFFIPLYGGLIAYRFIRGEFVTLPKSSGESLLTLLWPVMFYAVCGSVSWSLGVWLLSQVTSYICDIIVGISVHQHTDDCHEGDVFGQPDYDWGRFQVAATNDRHEFSAYLLLEQAFFGNHVLHHLFPTVDACRLNELKEIFSQTCQEFDIEHKIYSQLEMCYQPLFQFNRITPNYVKFSEKYKIENKNQENK